MQSTFASNSNIPFPETWLSEFKKDFQGIKLQGTKNGPVPNSRKRKTTPFGHDLYTKIIRLLGDDADATVCGGGAGFRPEENLSSL